MNAVARELFWGVRAVRREYQIWSRRAMAIPDAKLRRNAIAALQDKRPLLDGAALFWTIPTRRRPALLRLLVTFQILANYHDHAGERARGYPVEDPAGTMDGFITVLDLDQSAERYHPTRAQDGGYLAALVADCRAGCRSLPGYCTARDHLIVAARNGRTLDLEHHHDDVRRPHLLRKFAFDEMGGHPSLSWFELTAGASSMLTAIAGLALATDESTTAADFSEANDAYMLAATLSALLDNYVDLAEDRSAGSHNYLTYYVDLDSAVLRIAELIANTLAAVGGLRHGERHRVIVAAMVAMYLTSDGARSHKSQYQAALSERAGSLTMLLTPALAAWRNVRGEHGA